MLLSGTLLALCTRILVLPLRTLRRRSLALLVLLTVLGARLVGVTRLRLCRVLSLRSVLGLGLLCRALGEELARTRNPQHRNYRDVRQNNEHRNTQAAVCHGHITVREQPLIRGVADLTDLHERHDEAHQAPARDNTREHAQPDPNQRVSGTEHHGHSNEAAQSHNIQKERNNEH